MPTKSDEAAKDLYHSIMVEVMIRVYSLNSATMTPTPIPQPLIREYCFLQLRMLCELIALGCLVAHGDITKTKYFQKAYKADDILQRLEKLHPDFFPYPFKSTITPPSPGFPGELKMEDVETDYLKKDELIQLYVKCGSILHKGQLAQIACHQNDARARSIPRNNILGTKAIEPTQRAPNKPPLATNFISWHF
jgi:hypothetical protein